MNTLLPPVTTRQRIYSLDILRGAVMIIMALDHTRDFFHAPAFTNDPLDLATTTPILFFTRWITHYCAPVFVFLAGTSAFLQSQKKSKSELSGFLIKRGLWLIVIEIVVNNFGWTFNPHYNLIVLQVLWAIGISMVFLGLFIWLPYNVLLAVGILIVGGHNIFDFFPSTLRPQGGFWWDLLRNGDFSIYPISADHSVNIIYPFLPWLGLMILGFCFGKLYRTSVDARSRKKILIYLGTAIILFFIVLRFTNLYGDPNPWTTQKDGLYTLLSFINVHKYPPSLLFMCVTIGPAMIILALLENVNNKISKAITVYGRVPFFYYILHVYLLRSISVILFLSRGHTFSEGLKGIPNFPFKFMIPGEGYSLCIVYLIWILVVAALYPLCRWFNHYKDAHKTWWLSYL
ncbi:MAG: heparan-alpha-glucosaminide N-acetyltransferase domain-containing protein [Chitinophagales bacterium]